VKVVLVVILVYKSDLSTGHLKLGDIDLNNDTFSHY